MKSLVHALVAFLLVLSVSSCGTERAPAETPESPANANAVMLSADDLKDKQIGVLLGSVYDSFAAKTYPQATVLHFESTADLQLAVLTGKVAAGLGDEQPLVDLLRTNSDLAMFGETLLTLPLGVGFRKGEPELRDAFNRFLAEI